MPIAAKAANRTNIIVVVIIFCYPFSNPLRRARDSRRRHHPSSLQSIFQSFSWIIFLRLYLDVLSFSVFLPKLNVSSFLCLYLYTLPIPLNLAITLYSHNLLTLSSWYLIFLCLPIEMSSLYLFYNLFLSKSLPYFINTLRITASLSSFWRCKVTVVCAHKQSFHCIFILLQYKYWHTSTPSVLAHNNDTASPRGSPCALMHTTVPSTAAT